MGGGFRKRYGVPVGSMIDKSHKKPGVIQPDIRSKVYGLDPDRLKPKPISGGKKDADRVRLVKDFFAELPENMVIYQEFTKEVVHNPSTQNLRYPILEHTIPDNRTLFVDNVLFYATPAFGSGLVPSGIIEQYVQCYFEIGKVVPVEIRTTRVQTGLTPDGRAYFPFLNDRVGAREVTFSLIAKSGRELNAYYINRGGPSPIPLATVGVRVEGWLVDSNIIEEILEQQR